MALTVLGSGNLGGTYVLRIEVVCDIRVRFGRFMNGKQIAVPAGVYVYVGSAMGSDRRLGQRLARHVTRSGKRAGYKIRDEIAGIFGSEVLPKGAKRLRWHVDYLVDRREVVITDVIAIRSDVRLEHAIAEFLMANGDVIADGLGASDDPGRTHLVKVDSEMDWWMGVGGHCKLQMTRFARELKVAN